eukprot:7390191-Prymnesium_polylepis.1
MGDGPNQRCRRRSDRTRTRSRGRRRGRACQLGGRSCRTCARQDGWAERAELRQAVCGVDGPQLGAGAVHSPALLLTHALCEEQARRNQVVKYLGVDVRVTRVAARLE